MAGLLLGGVVLPAAGVIGIAARDAARTFSALTVPALGQLPLLTATSSAQQQAAQTDSAARKIRELPMAAQVEHEMSRPELLAAYLSVAYFAHHAYGVQAAAERYFSTSARRLDLVQSALLAGLVENPAGYDPGRHPAAARARRDVVLARMAQLGYITAGRAPAGSGRSPSTAATGRARALGQDSIDYAADTRDDGGLGVQTGSSSKLFTLLAALREGMPFGYRAHVVSPATISGYTSCRGQPAGPFLVSNAEGPGALDCPGAVYGANAGQIWQATFDRASLGSPPASFVPVPAGSRYYARGPGTRAPGAADPARRHRH